MVDQFSVFWTLSILTSTVALLACSPTNSQLGCRSPTFKPACVVRFWMWTNLTGVRWNLKMVFIWIFICRFNILIYWGISSQFLCLLLHSVCFVAVEFPNLFVNSEHEIVFFWNKSIYLIHDAEIDREVYRKLINIDRRQAGDVQLFPREAMVGPQGESRHLQIFQLLSPETDESFILILSFRSS